VLRSLVVLLLKVKLDQLYSLQVQLPNVPASIIMMLITLSKQ
jgi:hypothetical protein